MDLRHVVVRSPCSWRLMSALYEELDYQPTPLGPIVLRRRRVLSIDQDVYEIILGEEHLMSSLFTASEIALASLALNELDRSFFGEDGFHVVVGGLGLGYTAQAVLAHNSVRSLHVVEMLAPVIEWHLRRMVPLSPPLSDDPRCQLVNADFFAGAASTAGFCPEDPGKKVHAILIDIDHSPDFLLDERSREFYGRDGLVRLQRHLLPGGLVGLWSDAEPDEVFVRVMESAFETVRAEPVSFDNPLQPGRTVTQTVYLARKSLG